MAHEVVVTTLLDGPRNTTVHVSIRSDGVAGDLDSFEIVDPNDFQYPAGWDGMFTIEKIVSGMSGFSASLEFDYLVNETFIWAVPEYDTDFDFTPFGGLKDRSNTLDGTGKVLLSTRGLGVGDVGSFVLQLRK
jgi:hypothetical protein